MSEKITVNLKEVEVEVSVYDVVIDGVNCDFSADVDSDGDIRIEGNMDTDDMITILERNGYTISYD